MHKNYNTLQKIYQKSKPGIDRAEEMAYYE